MLTLFIISALSLYDMNVLYIPVSTVNLLGLLTVSFYIYLPTLLIFSLSVSNYC